MSAPRLALARPQPDYLVHAGVVVPHRALPAVLIELVAARTGFGPVSAALALHEWGLGGTLHVLDMAHLIEAGAEQARLVADLANGRVTPLDSFDGADRLPHSEAVAVAMTIAEDSLRGIVDTLAKPRPPGRLE